MHHQLFQKIEREGMLTNSFYKAITLIPRPNKKINIRKINIRN
jgi:hypothetical protein